MLRRLYDNCYDKMIEPFKMDEQFCNEFLDLYAVIFFIYLKYIHLCFVVNEYTGKRLIWLFINPLPPEFVLS